MNEDSWDQDGIRWTQDYLNGEIARPEFERLERLLLDSAEARAEFRRYTRTDLALNEIADGAGEQLRPLSASWAGDVERGARWSSARWLQAAAMIAMAAALAFLLAERAGGRPKPAAAPEADTPRLVQGPDFQDGAMAVLTHAVGVEWTGDLAYAEGAALREGVLEISKGLLQIEFFSGATVVVEGPAVFELVDPMHARCALGRVRANVPPFARGFTIDSAELKVVDLGTEFGFAADANGVKELHVFNGEVTVQGGAFGGEPRHVMGGTGYRVDNGDIALIPVVSEAFADSEQIASLSSAAAAEQRDLWMRYSEGLKADGDVLVYYSFDNQVAWSRQLSNDKKMVADSLYGAIVGCRWAEGRWRGKAALEFKRQTDRVRISIPGSLDTLTLMAWVRFDGLDRKLNSLMLSDGWQAGGLHWQVSENGELILGLRGENGTSGHYQSESLLGQHLLGEWLHLAVSYGGAGGKVRHFVNGREKWSGDVGQACKVRVPRGELGNWSTGIWPPERDIDIRNLNGRMDEFLVFSAALEPDEVFEFFEKGRPR